MEVVVAQEQHIEYSEQICQMIEKAARDRGTGIAKRSPSYIKSKIVEGKAVIALDNKNCAGFCYIESWAHGKYVANSGLIVSPEFRKSGLAKKIKRAVFELSLEKYPKAKIFGITTSLAVMKINAGLGYQPVTFSELTDDEAFWNGCQSCKNYDILTRTNRAYCLCTGMLYDPQKQKQVKETSKDRWKRFLRFLKYKKVKVTRNIAASLKMASVAITFNIFQILQFLKNT